jgi:hypothetical protein
MMTTLEDIETRLRTLEDIHAITQLKHRYFRLLDHKQWDELRDCFTDDVQTHYESGHYQFSGVDEIMAFLSESLEGLTAGGRFALHLGHHPEIELLSTTEARARWTLHAPVLDRGAGRVGWQDSFYEDEYRKQDGAWRISRIGYTSYTTASWAEPDLEMTVGDESDSREMNAGLRSSSGG